MTGNAEPILDPDLPICDAHHHLWDRPGHRYLLPDYVDDLASGHNIVSTVYIDCVEGYAADGPDRLKPVGETRFANAAADAAAGTFGRRGVCGAIVSFADLMLGAAVAEVLEAHRAASPRFRGIRHCATWHESDAIRNAHTNPPPGMLGSTGFRAGFAELSKLDLSFDAWVFHPQIDEVCALARAFPETVIVLNHLGGPLGIGPYANRREAVFGEWSSAIRSLAEAPNVRVKLGGMCMPLNGWGFHRRDIRPGSEEVAATLRDYFLHAIDCFGVDRCMFESNYPADQPSTGYAVLWNAYKRIVADFSAAEKRALFYDTAQRTYRTAG
jgi:predicted TIM-barrel fold metal-dependent hydrolase